MPSRISRADLATTLRQLLASVDGVAAAYLFGSHAEARAHRQSDIDVAVLLQRETHPSSRSRFEARLDLIGALGRALHPHEVDIVVLNDAPPMLGRRIVDHGILVWIGETQAHQAFVSRIRSRAADLAPWLERMQRIKLEFLAQ